MKLTLKFLILFLTGLISIACSTRPSNVLNRDKMYDVYKDMKLMEAYLANNYTSDSIREIYYHGILSKHKVSQAQYDSSLVWYSKNIQIFTPLLEKLSDELKNSDEFYSQLVKDSIRSDERKKPIIDDYIHTGIRRIKMPDSLVNFIYAYHPIDFNPMEMKDSLMFSFRIVKPFDEINTNDSLDVFLTVKANNHKEKINLKYKFLLKDTCISIPFPKDSIFTHLGKLYVVFARMNDKQNQSNRFITYIDSIRFDKVKEENNKKLSKATEQEK